MYNHILMILTYKGAFEMNKSIISGFMLSVGLLMVAISNPVLATTSVPASWACTGNCGTLGANGDVPASPLGGTYGYVSTYGGVYGNVLASKGGTNGTTLDSTVFSANAGDTLSYYFNYVTSDGTHTYPDYGWTNLLDSSGNLVATLFTYTTNTSIANPNATTWAPLGSWSGSCWATGCGNTGWTQSNYTIATSGQYMLQFGVANVTDTLYDSGLAFDGVSVGGKPIASAVPEPSTYAMLLAGLGLIGFIARRKNRQGGMLAFA